jgi:hypothetical protein
VWKEVAMPRDGTDRDAEFTEFVRNRQIALIRFAWLVSGGSQVHAEDSCRRR